MELGSTHTTSESAPATALAYCPADDLLLVGTGVGQVLVRPAGGAEVASVQAHSGKVTAIAFEATGKHFVTGGWDRMLRLWHMEANPVLLGETQLDSPIVSVDLSPAGDVAVAATEDGITALGVSSSGFSPLWRKAPFSGARSVAFSPNGDLVAVGGPGNSVLLLDANEGVLVVDLQGHAGAVRGVAYSPDGTRVASAGDDHTIQIWDVAKRDRAAAVAGLSQVATAIAFGPGGEILASGGADGTVRLWDSTDGAPVGSVHEHAGPVNAVLFAAGGRYVASAGDDGKTLTRGDVSKAWLAVKKQAILETLRNLERECQEKIANLTSPTGEFETTASFEKRLARAPVASKRLRVDYAKRRRAKKKQLEKKLELFLDRTGHPLKLSITVGRYDADAKEFPVSVAETGESRAVRVPLSEARSFKSAGAGGRLEAVGLRRLNFAGRWKLRDVVISLNGANKSYAFSGATGIEVEEEPASDLVLASVSFDDVAGNGNRILDADESARAYVEVRNDGKGPAPGVLLMAEYSGEASSYVQFAQTQWDVGNLAPGRSHTVQMEFVADENLPDGRIALRLEAIDKAGFAATPVEFGLKTRRLPHPELVVTKYWINDSSAGEYAKGDGDSVVEPNEGIEMFFEIANNGAGLATGVRTKLKTNSRGIGVSKSEAEVGDLAPGTTRTVKTCFKVPSTYAGPSKVRFVLSMHESRERFGREYPVVLEVGALQEEVVVMKLKGNLKEEGEGPTGVDVDTPPAGTPVSRPGSAALVVGIQAYKNLPEVFGAKRDAEVMAKYLREVMGFEDVKLLVGNDATKGLFESAVNKWLERQVEAGGDVAVYFAGHGSVDRHGEPYLMPYDASPEDTYGTGFKVAVLVDKLAGIPARNRLVMLDACFAARKEGPGGGDRPVVVTKLTDPANVALFTATGPNQISNPLKPKGHGLFTYYLLKGLGGVADTAGDGDGKVTLGELHKYVRDRVSVEAQKLGATTDQEPELRGPGSASELLLSRPEQQ